MTDHIRPDLLFPPWHREIPESLAKVGTDYLQSSLGLTIEQYSTARIVAGKNHLPAETIGRIDCDSGRAILCEPLAWDVASHFKSVGVIPLCSDSLDQQLRTVQGAVSQLRSYADCIFHSVATLALRIHIIQSSGDDYDTSYSDPSIPFSIFLSVPVVGKNAVLRTTESIVHEVCHLQLSLCERAVPLFIDGTGWTLYSPWKATERATPGIIHGLYVFKVLQWMWKQFCSVGGETEDNAFALRRIREIDEDVQAVSGVVDSPALTPEGRDFAAALLAAE